MVNSRVLMPSVTVTAGWKSQAEGISEGAVMGMSPDLVVRQPIAYSVLSGPCMIF